jgi:hypothetical protein
MSARKHDAYIWKVSADHRSVPLKMNMLTLLLSLLLLLLLFFVLHLSLPIAGDHQILMAASIG